MARIPSRYKNEARRISVFLKLPETSEGAQKQPFGEPERLAECKAFVCPSARTKVLLCEFA